MFKKKESYRRRGRGLALAALSLWLTGLLLAACGDNTATPAANPTTTQAGTTAASLTTAASNVTTAASAATTTATSATTAASAATAAASLAPVELTYIYRSVASGNKEVQLVQDELNKLLKAKINATIKMVPIDPGNYDQKIKLMLAANEKMDIFFTASWVNNYYQNVAQGNLIPLDDLLPKYAPKLWASLPQNVWNAARVNGKIYGVVNQQIFVRPPGVQIRKDLADKYSLDLSKVNGYADLEPFYDQLKKSEPGVTPLLTDDGANGILFKPEQFGYDPITDPIPLVIKADDADLKVLGTYDTPEFKAYIEMFAKWYKAGYTTKDPIPTGDFIAAFKAGKYSTIGGLVIKPGGEFDSKNRYGFDFVQKAFAKPILTTNGVVATLNGISANSANPERAAMFLELLNSDKEIYNLVAKGIEGKHWVFTDKDKGVIGFPTGITSATAGYNPNADWAFGNQFNAYYVNAAQVGSWDATKALNAESTPSTALGFSFNVEKVKTEAAQISAVISQYANPLMKGLVAPEVGLSELQNRLKQAGLDKVKAELQSQLDAWKKSK